MKKKEAQKLAVMFILSTFSKERIIEEFKSLSKCFSCDENNIDHSVFFFLLEDKALDKF